MKNILIASVLALSLALGGCGTTIGGVTFPTVAQVQAETALVCSYVPTASTISAIIAAAAAGGAGTAIVATANSIASGICAALIAAPAAQAVSKAGAPVATYLGVVIKGTYLVH